MTEFLVRAAARLRDDDLGADVLVLAEHEDGSGRRLELQRSLDVTEQDRLQGMDTYALSTETGAVHYGGIRAWSLESDQVQLDLDDEAAAALQADGGFRLTLADPGSQAAVIDSGLSEIVGDDIAADPRSSS